MARLSGLIQDSISAWGKPTLEDQVFGTTSPESISDQIDAFCRDHLGQRVVDASFYTTSVGCVSGVVLAEGPSVVIKAYQSRWTTTFLTAVLRLQRHLSAGGFPCPKPIAGPGPLGLGMATAEELVPDPGPAPLGPEAMTASAAGLARVVSLCRDDDPTGLAPHPLDAAPNGLYPEPHSPVFDFGATAAGAGWIDELALAARKACDSRDAELVIAHTDWSARNVRLGADSVIVAYDWDSLALVAETTAVGQAAATWSSFAANDPPVAPSARQIAAYVRRYEAARGGPFSPAKRDAIGAGALWVLAYTARCEHSLGPEGRGPQRARARLRAEGDALLRLGMLMAHGSLGS